MAAAFGAVTPVLRMYDLGKTREFYIDWLGFTIDWEHRFEPDLPVYMQISRAGCVLHLSQHHGDGSPNARVRIATDGLAEFHAELSAKRYGFNRPGLADQFDEKAVTVTDPVGNQITFYEKVAK